MAVRATDVDVACMSLAQLMVMRTTEVDGACMSLALVMVERATEVVDILVGPVVQGVTRTIANNANCFHRYGCAG